MLYVYVTVFSILLLVGAGIATVMIGFSDKNREGNPAYDKKTAKIFTGLSLYYAVPIILGLIAFAIYIFRQGN